MNVDIYLLDGDNQIAFLSIPRSDIQRLATRPFKRMRFVMFSICGARGDLAATPDGPPVDYRSTSLDGDRYYYKPSEEFAFVDPNGLNDRITSSSLTPYDPNFRTRERDGCFCVFTGLAEAHCDAAHLIPQSKGDEYIQKVIEKRARLYDSTQLPTISGIDAIENGLLLNKLLHSMFGHGAVTFLKTPNFAMDSTDIPRIERGSPHADHITVHQLESRLDYDSDEAKRLLDMVISGHPCPSLAFSTGLHVDALFQGTTDAQPPPAIILDFTYGVAAYSRWKSGPIHNIVNDYFAAHYESIPAPPRHHDNDNRLSRKGNTLADAMDEMNLVLMYLSGVTPEKAVEAREKRLEEEELMAREAGRTKVMEWRKTVG